MHKGTGEIFRPCSGSSLTGVRSEELWEVELESRLQAEFSKLG